MLTCDLASLVSGRVENTVIIFDLLLSKDGYEIYNVCKDMFKQEFIHNIRNKNTVQSEWEQHEPIDYIHDALINICSLKKKKKR